MAGFAPRVRSLSALALLLTFAQHVLADIGPGQGAGTRQVGSRKADAPQKKASSAKPTPARESHQLGRPPSMPSPTLPEGFAPTEPDALQRRLVAGGVTADRSADGVEDPQLNALRDAERILFPRNLSGFRPGFAWENLNPSVQASGLPPRTAGLPSATLTEAKDLEWLRSLNMPDFRVKMSRQVVEYLKFYRDSKRGQELARVWMAKSGRYTSAMQVELVRRGLPKDLVWLSLIESGHNPAIFSPAGAAGIWQFIPDSARMYGLTVDRWVDERLDPARATQAAAGYLSDLYQRFGSWDLAMAGYNMGHAGLMRSIVKYNSNDFSQLATYEAALPLETALYVPKVFAVAIVMNNRRAFGLDDVQMDPAVSFDSVFVDPGVDLEQVSKAAGIPLESLRSMNPQYLLSRVPPSQAASEKSNASRRWLVKVPRGLGRKCAPVLAKTDNPTLYGSVVVRLGDTLSSVAARRRTTEQELRALNQLGPSNSLTPGMVLLAPRLAGADVLASDREDYVSVPSRTVRVSGRRRVFYRALPQDTLADVAGAFKVTEEELTSWNDLDPAAKLQAGMSLQIFVPPSQNLSAARYVLPKHTRIFETASPQFVEHVEALNGRKRITVKVAAGDTLRGIGRRFGLSTGMMERINHVSRFATLSPGQILVVYAKRGRSESESGGRPLAKAEPPVPSALP